MKTFTTTLLLLLLLNGCAQQNAFEKFNLTSTKELSEDSIETFKLTSNGKVEGIVTAVYLNKVLPKLYHGNEYFYVYYYSKDTNASISFTLNNEPSMLREALPAENEFTYLTSFQAPWSNYFLLGFKKQGNILNLRAISSKGASATLRFVKDK